MGSDPIFMGTTLWGIYKSIATKVNHKLSLIVYLVMGWVGVIFIPVIIMRTSWLFILFIFLGGLSYTIGAWFYAQKNRPYFHMIWHIFIVIASVLHDRDIIFYVK